MASYPHMEAQSTTCASFQVTASETQKKDIRLNGDQLQHKSNTEQIQTLPCEVVADITAEGLNDNTENMPEELKASSGNHNLESCGTQAVPSSSSHQCVQTSQHLAQVSPVGNSLPLVEQGYQSPSCSTNGSSNRQVPLPCITEPMPTSFTVDNLETAISADADVSPGSVYVNTVLEQVCGDRPSTNDNANIDHDVPDLHEPPDDLINEPTITEKQNEPTEKQMSCLKADDTTNLDANIGTATGEQDETNLNRPALPKNHIVSDETKNQRILPSSLVGCEDKSKMDDNSLKSSNSLEESLQTNIVSIGRDLQREGYDEKNLAIRNDVSYLLKNVVLVQASLFEAVEPGHEDINPVVGGCIDDIGRVEELLIDDAIDSVGLLVDETGDMQDYDAMDGIEVGQIEQIVPLEAGIIDPNEIMEEAEDLLIKKDVQSSKTNKLNDESLHNKHVSTPANKREHYTTDHENYLSASDSDGSVSGESLELIPNLNEVQETIGLTTDDEIELSKNETRSRTRQSLREKSESKARMEENSKQFQKVLNKSSTPFDSDINARCKLNKSSGNDFPKRKKSSIRTVDISKELLNVDEENSGESSPAIKIKTNKRRKQSNNGDDPFDSSSASQDVPNDAYFGTQDRVSTVNTELRPTKATHCRFANDAGSRLKRRTMKKVEEIACLELPAYQQQQLQNMVLKKQPTRDRFYDRSQDIPNDIYFENMKVPLHILHGISSSSSEEETRTDVNHRTKSRSDHEHRNPPSKQNASSSARQDMTNQSLQSMKLYLKIAGFRHVRFQKLWEGCHTSQERAEAILRFLQASGLQGEPTVESCRELRKQIQLENEAKVLDVSAIIDSGEGRITRQRTKMLSIASVSPNTNRQDDISTGHHPASEQKALPNIRIMIELDNE